MLAKKMKESIERAMRSDLGPQVHEESSEPGSFRLRMCWNEEARNWTSSIQPCDIIEGCTMATRQFLIPSTISNITLAQLKSPSGLLGVAHLFSGRNSPVYYKQLTSPLEEKNCTTLEVLLSPCSFVVPATATRVPSSFHSQHCMVILAWTSIGFSSVQLRMK